jgi:hypothetical protein
MMEQEGELEPADISAIEAARKTHVANSSILHAVIVCCIVSEAGLARIAWSS